MDKSQIRKESRATFQAGTRMTTCVKHAWRAVSRGSSKNCKEKGSHRNLRELGVENSDYHAAAYYVLALQY